MPTTSTPTRLMAKWQFSANGMYQAPYGVEVAGSIFGRQGYPFPLYRSQALGADTLNVLVSPKVDTFRLDDVWNTDLRLARQFQADRLRVRAIFDVFNIMNANTALVRVSDVNSTVLNSLAQNLSPRIARLGVVIGF